MIYHSKSIMTNVHSLSVQIVFILIKLILDIDLYSKYNWRQNKQDLNDLWTNQTKSIGAHNAVTI